MATLTIYHAPTSAPADPATLTVASTTHIQIVAGPATIDFYGSGFTYGGGGITGGTLTQFTYANASLGGQQYAYTGLQHSAVTTFNLFLTNPAGLTPYLLNGNDTVLGSAENDLLGSQTGTDTITGGRGNDSIDGGSGTDTAAYSGAMGDYTLTLGGTLVGVKDNRAPALSDGTDSLFDIERLQFSDQRLALDMGVAQAGGKTVLMMAATLGAGFPLDKGWAGTFLKYFDSGASLLDGAQLLVGAGIVAAFAGGSDNAAFVKFIYNNVNGSLPDAATLASLVAPLDAHTTTQAQWMASMAASDANQVHAQLIGYVLHGLAFTV